MYREVNEWNENLRLLGERIRIKREAMDHRDSTGRYVGTRHSQSWLRIQFELNGVWVSNNTISCWENGTKCPTLHHLVVLARILYCSLDELVMGDSGFYGPDRPNHLNSFLHWTHLLCPIFFANFTYRLK